jgi:hypothetical protein
MGFFMNGKQKFWATKNPQKNAPPCPIQEQSHLLDEGITQNFTPHRIEHGSYFDFIRAFQSITGAPEKQENENSSSITSKIRIYQVHKRPRYQGKN